MPHPIRTILVPLAALLVIGAACTSDNPSCYAPAARDYVNELTLIGEPFEDYAPYVRSIDESTALVLTSDIETHMTWAWRVDLATGERARFDEWHMRTTPIRNSLLSLPDGRFLSIGGIGTFEYVIFDPAKPNSAAIREFETGGELDNISFEFAFLDPATGAVYVAITDWIDGNTEGAGMMIFDPDRGKLTNLGLRVEGVRFNDTSKALSLCDGRFVLPGSLGDGGDHYYPRDEVFYFEPAIPSLGLLDVGMGVYAAAPIDSERALLIGRSEGELHTRVLELESGTVSEVDGSNYPNGVGTSLEVALFGLADGRVLALDNDGDLHTFDPAGGGFVESGWTYGSSLRDMALTPDGRVLGMTQNGDLMIYR